MMNKQSGFSLLELVLVIILIGVISAVASTMLSNGLSGLIAGQNATEANWQGQLAMERMIRDIRAARSQVDLTTLTAGEFSFTDINGNSIDYKLSGTNLIRNSTTLATGVNSLTFTYYDSAGATSDGTTNTHYVGVTINITQSNASYVLTSGAYLRNLSS